MNADRWRQIETVCGQALARPPEARAAFLDATCAGDAELRREVESLIAEEPAAERFLETPAVVAVAGAFGSAGSEASREAALGPGARFGRYEITGFLGAGGMGEVYRARDTTLNREVALKLLPRAFAADRDRVHRFEREARALAALNHPNIAQIYEFEQIGTLRAIAMEFVEGQSLAELGRLAVDEALPIARQVAAALEAAHDRGIIHRDLKPGNVIVRSDGAVKVLDFGLAKATHAAGTASAGSSIEAGMILGTAAYMSPEQARGQPVDRRTDIWAFGCVLYEMLTGQRAFGDDDVSMTLSKVLRQDPDFDALPSSVPARVRQLLHVCLQKDVRQRAADVHDVCLAFDGAFETSAPMMPGAGPKGRRAALMAIGAGGLVVGALLAGTAMWLWETRASAPAPIERVSLMTPVDRPVVFEGVPNRALALSPDGTELVYVARKSDHPGGSSRTGLEWRSLATREVRDLPGTDGALQPFFSPDGQWIGFFAGGALKKVSLAGGNPITLADRLNSIGAGFGVWLDDGTIVFGALASGLRRLSADGGTVTDLTTLDTARGEEIHSLPALVRSTGAIVFSVFSKTGHARIEAVRLDTGERHVVVDDAWDPFVLNDRYLLFQRQDTTLIAPFDARHLTIAGPAVSFTEDVRPDGLSLKYRVAELAMSRSGTLAYIPAETSTAGTLGLVGRDGIFQSLAVPPGHIKWPRVAPDGRALAFVEIRGTGSSVRIYELSRGSTTRRGREDGVFGPAVWQPGTGSLAVSAQKGDVLGVFLDGSDGVEKLLVPTPPGTAIRNIAWSPDGRHLAYTVQTLSQHDIWILTPDGEPSARPLLHGTAREFSPAFSPDGHWLAYVSDESGRTEVYIQQYPRGERFTVSVGGGNSPVWRHDGRELFFAGVADNRPAMMAVSVAHTGTSLRLGQPAALFDLEVTGPSGESDTYEDGSNWGVGYDVLPDGRFVMVRYPDESTAREIVLVRNWLGELHRLMAAK